MITKRDKSEFRKTFGVPIEHFKGTLNSVLPLEETGIDIVKFCKWLDPYYMEKNKSGADIVRERYGEKAVKLVERVI